MPGKAAIKSMTIVSLVVTMLTILANLGGYALSSDDQAALGNLIQNGYIVVTSAIGIISTALAIWGRVRATQQITSILPKVEQ